MFSIPYWVRTYWAFEGIKDIQSTNQKMFFFFFENDFLITRQRRLKARDSKNKQHLNLSTIVPWLDGWFDILRNAVFVNHTFLFVCMFVCFLVFCCINLTKLLHIRICTYISIYIHVHACMHIYIYIIIYLYIHIHLHNACVSSH